MTKRLLTLTTLLAAAGLIFAVATRKKTTLEDPLRKSGLEYQEVRVYLYLLALQDVSRGQKVAFTKSGERVREYLRSVKAAYCSCGRWFLEGEPDCIEINKEEIYTTTKDHAVKVADAAELLDQVIKWDMFRDQYLMASRIGGLPEPVAVNLHYYTSHLNEG